MQGRSSGSRTPADARRSTPSGDDVTDDDQARFFEVYENTPRQGPGSVETTRRALAQLPESLAIERVLDLGCGTGGSTLVLAEETPARITAVDLHPPFLATLRAEAERRGLGDRIATLAADMGDAASLGSGFDLIWAEGSAYSIGFENALRSWRPLLRAGGCLVVSELVWFSARPDPSARAFFEGDYPDMCDEATRIAQAEALGYAVLDAFRLPADDWRAYYEGLAAAIREAVARRGEHPVFATLRKEIDVFEAHGADYGYLCIILQVEGPGA